MSQKLSPSTIDSTRRPTLDSPIVSTVRFDIPDEVLAALGVEVVTALGELRFAAAVKLYELGRLSSGAAAQLAGVPRVGFLARLGEFGATVNQDEAEIAGDLERA